MLLPATPADADKAINYPESDGAPTADNTLQYQWIVLLQGGLDALFSQKPDVFVAADLLWYPIEGDNRTRIAPDVLVVFGRPKGHRGPYRQWQEDNIAPQVVFEILSPGNRAGEMIGKALFYDRFGVEEYYLYDPDRNEFSAWLRSPQTGRLENVDAAVGWVSPRLGVRFDPTGPELAVFRPDGTRFQTFVELSAERDAERRARLEAEDRAARLAEQLRAPGIDPDAETGNVS